MRITLVAILILTIMLLPLVIIAKPSGKKIYVLKVEYVAYGNEMTITDDILSTKLILAPTIDGWQKLLEYKVYIDGEEKTSIFIKKKDSEGNVFLSLKKPILASGSINITFVQRIEVEPAGIFGSRIARTLPENCVWGKPNVDEKYLYIGPSFWGYSSEEYSFSNLKELASEIREYSENPCEYVVNVVEWVMEHTNYSLGLRGGITSPSIFIKTRTGACGDIHSLIVTLLRIERVPAYLYFAYFYRDGEIINITDVNAKVQYLSINALPHAFAMAYINGTWFPIDITLPRRERGETLNAINNAGVNIFDRVIVVYRVVSANPNDFLLISAPSNDSSIYYRVSLFLEDGALIITTQELELVVVVTAIAVIIALLFLLSRETSKIF